MINTNKRLGRKYTYTAKHTNIYLLFRDNALILTTTNYREIVDYITRARVIFKGYNICYMLYGFKCDIYGHYYQIIREFEII